MWASLSATMALDAAQHGELDAAATEPLLLQLLSCCQAGVAGGEASAKSCVAAFQSPPAAAASTGSDAATATTETAPATASGRGEAAAATGSIDQARPAEPAAQDPALAALSTRCTAAAPPALADAAAAAHAAAAIAVTAASMQDVNAASAAGSSAGAADPHQEAETPADSASSGSTHTSEDSMAYVWPLGYVLKTLTVLWTANEHCQVTAHLALRTISSASWNVSGLVCRWLWAFYRSSILAVGTGHWLCSRCNQKQRPPPPLQRRHCSGWKPSRGLRLTDVPS